MLKFVVFSFISLTAMFANAGDCISDIKDKKICALLTVDGLSVLLNTDESAYENPTTLTAVTYVKPLEKAAGNVQVEVNIEYKTVYTEDGEAEQTSTDTCQIMFSTIDGKTTPIYGYCYDMGKEFENISW